METLAALTARHAGPGRLVWIGRRPGRRTGVEALPTVEVTAAGLAGDHARPGPRAVTLIQAEHLPVIAALAHRGAVTPDMLRRNLVIAGLNLAALRDRSLAIGPDLRLTITGPCAPCSRMEEVLGPGGYTALRGHGGWCARVDTPGRIAVGDAVLPLP